MNHGRVTITCVLLLTLGIATKSYAVPPQTERLGKVRFVNSCSPQVQTEFDSALAMLHSFQYGLAEKTFSHVAQRDPQCAMAYWGAAMTLYHQLWDWPSAETLKKGFQYLEKARPLRKKTERELAYLNAAAAFYQPEQKLGQASRVQAYSKAMLDLHERYPQDDDATAFYALSLLALPSVGDDGLVNQRKALAILTELFSAQPEHPGAAHYLIHAADTPELAPQGLPAALRYAQIAPASPHALHMPAHIFARLGMWQESIASNLASLSAADEATKSQRDDGSGDALHAMMYLAYSYLQSGEDKDARQVVDRIQAVPGARVNDVVNNQAILEALYAVETHQWKQAAALTVRPEAFPYAQVRTFWARAIGAARNGDILSARQNIDQLDQARAGMLAHIRSVDAQMHMCHSVNSDISVQQLEAKAWLAWAEGRSAEALDMMRAAATKEEFYAVESRTVPAYEMLGDMLLELHQPKSALVAYETALKEAPARFNALAGAARASQALDNREKARFYYAALVKCCGPGVTRKEFGEATSFLSGN
jgi:tetratricopeptide (TPR) repeat protein